MSKIARKLAKSSAYSTMNFFIQIVVVFFLMPFVVHSLGERMYGFWTLIATFIGYYGLLDFGLSVAVNRHIATAIGSEDTKKCNKIFCTAFFIYTLIGVAALLISIVLYFLAPFIVKNPADSALFANVMLILGLNFLFEFPMKTYNGILAAQLRHDIIALISIISLAIRTSLIVLILHYDYNILALTLVTVLSGVPGKILSVYYTKKEIPGLRLRFRFFNNGIAKRLFSFSSYTFLAKITEQFRFNIGFMVIMFYISLTAVTHYKIACTLVIYFYTLVTTMLGVFFPLFSQQFGAENHKGLNKSFFFSTKLAICITGFIGFGLIGWGHPFIEVWMGQQYVEAYPSLVYLTLAAMIHLTQAASPALLIATAHHKVYAIYCFFEILVSVLLSILLVQFYGFTGVAIATLISVAITRIVLQPVYVCRVLEIPLLHYVTKVGQTFFSVSVALLIPLLITVYFVKPNYGSLLTVGFLAFLSYALVIWLMAISSDEKQVFINALFSKSSAAKKEA